MKKPKDLIRSLNLLPVIILTVACNSSSLDFKVKETSAAGGKESSSGNSIAQPLDTANVRVKNYNQYNMSLQKLTGINRSNHIEIFESIKASLPSTNEISGMTPFNLIAMSRLADSYCAEYVQEKIPSDLFGGQDEALIDHMIETFLDDAPEDQPEYYSVLKTELRNIYANDDGMGNRLFPAPDTNAVQASKDYTIAACVTILASPYITLLE